jgi:hypothetical protein
MSEGTFELKEEHLKLLRRMFVSWDDCEFGAPAIDPKRPYGNSDVYEDISEILGIVPEEETKYEKNFSEAQYAEMGKLHRGTLTALQIALVTGKFELGTYKKRCQYDETSWEKGP